MKERSQHSPEETQEKTTGQFIDPEYVKAAFLAVINERRETSLRKPVSMERLWEVFDGAENKPHTLEELAANLPPTKHTDRDIASLISRLNKALERVGYNIMIKHVTAYQIVERPIEENPSVKEDSSLGSPDFTNIK